MEQFSRTENILGSESMEKLHNSHVAVFGIGGVGGYAAESLARTGVGALSLFDHDTVSLTNLNRQIIALHSTLGKSKVQLMAERIRDISPETAVFPMEMFYLPENADSVDISQFDYVVDCVDTVAAKLNLAEKCSQLAVPIISAMGAGNKMNPGLLRVADINETSVDPLSRVMRRECRKRGIHRLKVVFSTETPIEGASPINEEIPAGSSRHNLPGSAIFVPASMGIMIAAEVVKDLISGCCLFHNKDV